MARRRSLAKLSLDALVQLREDITTPFHSGGRAARPREQVVLRLGAPET